ncbi:MAG: alpha/beta fold hydrolase [Saprospiraceae bacterium]
MTEDFFQINNNQFNYLRFGSGPDVLIAIPGYGERASIFEQLKESLSQQYTVYALQLPLHGSSEWQGNSFHKKGFQTVFEKIKEKENKEKVSLMGYSFGARVICSMLEDIHPFVEKLFLLAPDGFNQQYINRATFLPKGIRLFLQSTLNRPFWYLGIARGLHQLGLLKSYSLLFVERHLATEKRRKRLFLFWNSLDGFRYEEEKIGELIEHCNIATCLIMGNEDVVIPTEKWKTWGKNRKYITIQTLDEGHRIIGPKLNRLLVKI